MKKYYILTVLVLFILNTQAKKPIEKARKKPINSSTNIKPADWFNDILVAFANLVLPVWGEYSEGGTTNRNYPLACADRKYQENIKSLILNAVINKTDSAPTVRSLKPSHSKGTTDFK